MTTTTWYLDAEGLYHRLGTEDGDKFRTDDDDTVVACSSEAGRDAPETAPPIELRCCWCELPMSARLERAAHEWLEGTLLDVGLPDDVYKTVYNEFYAAMPALVAEVLGAARHAVVRALGDVRQ